jgi:hypothetical protein
LFVIYHTPKPARGNKNEAVFHWRYGNLKKKKEAVLPWVYRK